MNFWERVEDLLEKQDCTKKQLAQELNFSASNITKGIKENNIPSVKTAYDIAKFLGVSVEYLVSGEIDSNKIDFQTLTFINKQLPLIRKLQTLSVAKLNFIKRTIQELDNL